MVRFQKHHEATAANTKTARPIHGARCFLVHIHGILHVHFYSYFMMPTSPTFSLSSTVRTYPTHPYNDIKCDILGKRYTLSLTFVGPDRARRYNEEHRGKTYVPNVLSFPLDSETGEIIICPSVAAREAQKFNLSSKGYIAYLFIHGLLHLKGYDHGATMEKLEQRYVKKYHVA